MALTITKTDVIQIAPELSAVDDAIWTLLIGWAGDEIGANVGAQAFQNRCGRFLVAHMATLWPNTFGAGGNGGPGFAGGPVTSTKVGEVSVTTAAAEAWTKLAVTAAALATTAYGREFLRLIRLGIGPAVALAN